MANTKKYINSVVPEVKAKLSELKADGVLCGLAVAYARENACSRRRGAYCYLKIVCYPTWSDTKLELNIDYSDVGRWKDILMSCLKDNYRTELQRLEDEIQRIKSKLENYPQFPETFKI